MKFIYLLTALLLTGCASNYNPYVDKRIAKTPVCQSTLKTLVENNAFMEVKSMVDKKCNNLVVKGWAKGRVASPKNKRCIASFQYLKKRPILHRAAKEFIVNSCYYQSENYYVWKKPAHLKDKE
jgi:hypothetical protein